MSDKIKLALARILWGVPVFDPAPTPEVDGETPQQWFERATKAEQQAWVRWARWFPFRLLLGVFGVQILAVTVLGFESPHAAGLSFAAIVYGFLSLDLFRLSLRVSRWARR